MNHYDRITRWWTEFVIFCFVMAAICAVIAVVAVIVG